MAVGGGLELMISADIVIAVENARFSLPEIKAGTLADAATIKLPRRIPYHVAMDLLLTGRWMDSKEAKHWGLVNEVVHEENLLPRAREVAKLLSDGPPLVFAAVKEVMRMTEDLTVQESFDLLRSRKISALNKLYSSEDHKEGPRAFLEKRLPVWKGK